MEDEDLEMRKAEFYYEWCKRKASRKSGGIGGVFLGPIARRIDLREWKQAFTLLLFYILIGVLIAKGLNGFSLTLFLIIWLYEFFAFRLRLDKFNAALEEELISKWGADAVSK